MKNALIVLGVIIAVALYMTWMGGLFRRCPYCQKIGSWRFDDAEPAVKEKDADGWVGSSSQVRVCRKCGNKVLDKWSDHDGRKFEKMEETKS